MWWRRCWFFASFSVFACFLIFSRLSLLFACLLDFIFSFYWPECSVFSISCSWVVVGFLAKTALAWRPLGSWLNEWTKLASDGGGDKHKTAEEMKAKEKPVLTWRKQAKNALQWRRSWDAIRLRCVCVCVCVAESPPIDQQGAAATAIAAHWVSQLSFSLSLLPPCTVSQDNR